MCLKENVFKSRGLFLVQYIIFELKKQCFPFINHPFSKEMTFYNFIFR